MLRLINNSTAYYGTGLSIQRKLFKIKSGPYAGRMVAVYPSGPMTISLSYADPPYIEWSSPQGLLFDCADYPVSCWMDSPGNIFVAYTVSASLNLAYRKISFINGNWTAGAAYTIFNADNNYYPNLFRDIYYRLWVSWTRISGGLYYINAKISVNDGEQWGLGPDDQGWELASGQSSAFSRLEYLPTHAYCFYTVDGTRLAYRRYELAGSVWQSEVEVFTGSGLAGNFCTAVSDDLRLGLIFMSDSDLYFRNFDGFSWSGNYLIDTDITSSPIVKYKGAIPFVFYGKDIGPGQNQLFYSFSNAGSFSTPTRVTGELASFDRVICYRPAAMAQHYDRSISAADDSPADIYHPDSNALIKDTGDALLLGQSEKFNLVHITLSSTGAGGMVSWYYWDGSNWINFTPTTGDYNFDSSPAHVRLWEDSSTIPADWQSSVIAGHSKFWIRITVTSGFGTAPVGTQITATAELPFMTAL